MTSEAESANNTENGETVSTTPTATEAAVDSPTRANVGVEVNALTKSMQSDHWPARKKPPGIVPASEIVSCVNEASLLTPAATGATTGFNGTADMEHVDPNSNRTLRIVPLADVTSRPAPVTEITVVEVSLSRAMGVKLDTVPKQIESRLRQGGA